jgi:hypothetical protein
MECELNVPGKELVCEIEASRLETAHLLLPIDGLRRPVRTPGCRDRNVPNLAVGSKITFRMALERQGSVAQADESTS